MSRSLLACGAAAVYDPDTARIYLTEAIDLARRLGDKRRLSQGLWFLAKTAAAAGEPRAGLAAGTEGRRVAEEIGDRFVAYMCRFWGIGTASMLHGDFIAAAAELRALASEAEAAHDPYGQLAALSHLSHALAYMGDTHAAREAAASAATLGAEFGGFMEGVGYAPLARAALAAGDVAAATEASEVARQRLLAQPVPAANANPLAEIALARGDLPTARRYADEAVALTKGVGQATALVARARVAIAQDEPEQAERDAHDALAVAVAVGAHIPTPDALECLAAVTDAAGGHQHAARLLGAADALRHAMGIVRYKVYDAGYQTMITSLRDGLGDSEFETAWTEGAALTLDEAIAYARRGRGERKRPTSGWGSLTRPSLTSSGSSGRALPTKTSPRDCSSRHAPWRPISLTSTQNWASPPGCSSLRKQPATADPRNGASASRITLGRKAIACRYRLPVDAVRGITGRRLVVDPGGVQAHVQAGQRLHRSHRHRQERMFHGPAGVVEVCRVHHNSPWRHTLDRRSGHVCTACAVSGPIA